MDETTCTGTIEVGDLSGEALPEIAQCTMTRKPHVNVWQCSICGRAEYYPEIPNTSGDFLRGNGYKVEGYTIAANNCMYCGSKVER